MRARKFAWRTETYEHAMPYISGDEYWRTLLVVPWPFKYHIDEDGDRVYQSLAITILPWWAWKWNRKNAAYIYHERLSNEVLFYLDEEPEVETVEGQARWEKVFDLLHEVRPKPVWDD